MTSIVGILCKDGVVIATDSSATFDNGQVRTIEQPFDKLDVISNKIIIAGTGQIGLGQRFSEMVRKAWEEKTLSGSPIEIGKLLSAGAIKDFGQTGATKGVYGALVAFPAEHRHHLCEFGITDFQPELKTKKLWFCSMGSAQLITDPFLAFIRDVFWNDGMPTLNEGIFAATWTLDQAIKVNPGGVNGPVKIAVLETTNNKQLEARILSDNELGEHRQNIEEAKKALKDYKQRHTETATIPSVPKLDNT